MQPRRWPYVTIFLVGLNLVIFVFEVTLGSRLVPFLQEWGLVPARVNAEITLHNMATVVTSMFLHMGVLHVVGNVWILLAFGDAVEDALGHWWFLLLYLVAGFFGGMAFIGAGPGIPIPGVGASGAIAGVMAASLVMWPPARIKALGIFLLLYAMSIAYWLLLVLGLPKILLGGFVLFVVGGALSVVLMTRRSGRMGFVRMLLTGVPLPVWLVLLLFMGQQLVNGAIVLVNPAYGSSIGWWAHIGGFAAGAVCAYVFPKHPQKLAPRIALQ